MGRVRGRGRGIAICIYPTISNVFVGRVTHVQLKSLKEVVRKFDVGDQSGCWWCVVYVSDVECVWCGSHRCDGLLSSVLFLRQLQQGFVYFRLSELLNNLVTRLATAARCRCMLYLSTPLILLLSKLSFVLRHTLTWGRGGTTVSLPQIISAYIQYTIVYMSALSSVVVRASYSGCADGCQISIC